MGGAAVESERRKVKLWAASDRAAGDCGGTLAGTCYSSGI